MLANSTNNSNSKPMSQKRFINASLVSIWVTVGLVVGTILGALIMRFLYVTLPVGVFNPGSPANTLILAALVYSLTVAVVIGVPWLAWNKRTTLAELGLSGLPTWRDVLLPIVGFVTYAVVAQIVLTTIVLIFPSFEVNQVQNTGFNALSSPIEYMIAFFALVILAPFMEELIFRGYLYAKLRSFKVPLWAVFLIVSVLFGAAHLQLNVAINVFVLSLVLCGLRAYTGSLWASILLHSLKNGLAFWLLFVNHSVLSTIGS